MSMSLAEKIYEFSNLAFEKYNSHAYAKGAFEAMIMIMENNANAEFAKSTLDHMIAKLKDEK